ncbi:MAG: tyrosine-type recombinase/integrase [Acidimicrobiales bacterium]
MRAEADQLRGEWGPTSDDPGTVGEWADRWLAGAHHLKPTTRVGHRSMLRAHVIPRWGGVAVDGIRREDVAGWVGEMVDAGHQPDVIRRSVDVLRMALAAALADGVIAANPVAGIHLPRPPRHDMRPLTVEQVEALADAIAHPDLKPGGNGAKPTGRADRPDLALAVRLAAYTGLRAGELWALRRKDLDLAARTIRVRESLSDAAGQLAFGPTKTGASRAVTWPAVLDDAISRHLATRPPDPDSLMFSSAAASPVRHRALMRRHFKPALVRAGLAAGTRWHDLRHTHASLLKMSDVAPDTSFDTVRDHQPPGPSCPLCGSVLATAG